MLLGDQMAVLASDLVRTSAVAPLPNSGARSCAGVYTFAIAPLPNSGARSVLWRGDCCECVRGVLTLFFSTFWVMLVWAPNTPRFYSQPTAAVTPFLICL